MEKQSLDNVDNFGLTNSMRAAALGDLEAVKAAHKLRSLFETRNPCTNANLLHYAAQAVKGGAEIINWAIFEANASIELLNERILVQREGRMEGNGHTVAMEAVFNRNAEVVGALIKISDLGCDVDLTTPALTGRTPLGFAVRAGLAFANDLAEAVARAFARQEDDDWVSKHPGNKDAIDLAVELGNFVLRGGARESIEALLGSALVRGVDVKARYGRLGQPLLSLIPTWLSANGLQAEEEKQQERYAEVVDLLIQKYADPTIKETGLMQVSAGFRDAVFGYQKGLKRMIESIPEEGMQRQTFIDEQGIMNGYTRLIDAALSGRTDVIELLLHYNPDRSIKGFNGRTAYAAAVTYNDIGKGEKIPDQVLERLRT